MTRRHCPAVLIAAPLKIVRGSGSPLRVLAITPAS